jgi:formylglycine-generating enzyme required for sulfatase activity
MICASCGHETPARPCAACGLEPRLDGRFALDAMLGQGSFGTTWRAQGPDGEPVALKEMLMRPELQEQVEREVRVLRQLSHPGVPRYVEAFRSRSGRYASQVLVMELIEGQTIAEERAVRRYGVLDIVELVQELAEILAYLHGLAPPVIHRDLKPANIMRRSEGGLVLIDFGLVRDTVVATLGGTREVGSLGYQAPEQFAGDPVPASDLYGLGAVAVHLLTQREPHELVRALYEPMRWRRYAAVTDEVATLIDRLVAPEPADRFASAAEVVAACRALRQAGGARAAIDQVHHGPATPAEEPPHPRATPSARARTSPALADPPSTGRFDAIRPSTAALPSEHFEVEGVELTMLRLPPGAYQRGSPTGEAGRSHEERMHLVQLSRPFWLGVVPVTRALWGVFSGRLRADDDSSQLAAEDLSWEDAVRFCNRLSERAGFRPAYRQEVLAPATVGFWGLGARPELRRWVLDPGADGFRLPTEGEWEYAARAGSGQPWAGSTNPDEVAWHLGNAEGMAQPVGGLLPNAWGLHDMSGNIWEWCWDWYHAYPTQPVTDPQGPSAGTYRVIRGGCAQYHRDYARVARRGGRRPERRYFYVGFRLARNAGG